MFHAAEAKDYSKSDQKNLRMKKCQLLQKKPQTPFPVQSHLLCSFLYTILSCLKTENVNIGLCKNSEITYKTTASFMLLPRETTHTPIWLLMFHHPVQISLCLHFFNFKLNNETTTMRIKLCMSCKLSYNFSAPAGKTFCPFCHVC